MLIALRAIRDGSLSANALCTARAPFACTCKSLSQWHFFFFPFLLAYPKIKLVYFKVRAKAEMLRMTMAYVQQELLINLTNVTMWSPWLMRMLMSTSVFWCHQGTLGFRGKKYRTKRSTTFKLGKMKLSVMLRVYALNSAFMLTCTKSCADIGRDVDFQASS